MARAFWPLPPTWETQVGCQPLALAWPGLSCRRHGRNEPVDGRSLSVSLSSRGKMKRNKMR